MATAHRAPVIDSEEELSEIQDEWQDFIDSATYLSAHLEQYGEEIKRDGRVERAFDNLVESYDKLLAEKNRVNRRLESSSLRGHASYPVINSEGEEYLEQKLGAKPEKVKRESPVDLYYTIATSLDHDGIDWKIEKKSVDKLHNFDALINECKDAAAVSIPVEGELPDTSVDGLAVDTEVFQPLIDAYRSTTGSSVYRSISSYEEAVSHSQERSAAEEIRDLEVERV